MMVHESDITHVLKERLRGRNQKALAEELGISQQYVNMILNGKKRITRKIAKKLGYEMITIFAKIDE